MKPVTVVSFEEAHISDISKSQHIKLLTGATLMTFRKACFFTFFGENAALNLVMTVLGCGTIVEPFDEDETKLDNLKRRNCTHRCEGIESFLSANGSHYANREAVGGRRRGNTVTWLQDEDGKVHFSEPWIIPPQKTGSFEDFMSLN